ncbi:CPBP family intramembrane glutamic endopeptidase [Microbacterium caowuchunii]|uniref:CPBP family intramembrane metalloprotease n=1 Tax=Microbacterium caowuchunii TaxID=2614638 RepID=A0A5N0T9M2_9MICO|nr:type II CAAX endopeptidase family protein [Microbacterium caowuchunii]KAA9131743.1 CPBP family intramembrane metalloprotease [Microbacterium caowuchunii]
MSESIDRRGEHPSETPPVGDGPDAAGDGPGRPSRFSRSESGEWVAERTGAEPFSAGVGAALAAGGGTGTLVTGPLDAADTAAVPDDAEERERGRRRRPRAPRMWLQGGTSTLPWGWMLVGWALISLGAGVLVATIVRELVGGTLGGWIATVILWAAMIVPVVLAFARSVPRGLMRFRATDVLFGLVFGVVLRFVAGGLEQAASGRAAWPAYPTVDGRLPGDWWFTDLAVPVVVAPAIEEFFFHALLLVALYTAFRRLTRQRVVAGFGAALVSTGLFVLLHELTGSLGVTWPSATTIALVGLVGSVLVLLTGRIWGAVLTHVVFNATFVLLALVGTLTGVGGGALS